MPSLMWSGRDGTPRTPGTPVLTDTGRLAFGPSSDLSEPYFLHLQSGEGDVDSCSVAVGIRGTEGRGHVQVARSPPSSAVTSAPEGVVPLPSDPTGVKEAGVPDTVCIPGPLRKWHL